MGSTTISDNLAPSAGIVTMGKAQYADAAYTQDEMDYRSMLIYNATVSRQRRDTSHVEFDNMTYPEWWENNNKIRNGYIEPKQNPSDINATTGTAREKTNSMLASLLSLNLEPSFEAYDKNGVKNDELGQIMGDLERKSREMECPDYDWKRTKIYDEYLTQGIVHTRERFREFSVPQFTLENLDISNIEKAKIERGMDKAHKYCDTELLLGLNVYPGNIREPSLENQPFMFVRRILSMKEAQAIYGKWDRWKNVPLMKRDFFAVANDYRPYNNWTLVGFREQYVEELEYFDKWANQYMILLNGTMMFPVKKDTDGNFLTMPLTSINGVCEYPIAKGDNESMPNFYYSRSIPSKTRVEQQLMDETVKAMVWKMRQSYRPPMGNMTGEEVSADIFDPATIWDDLDADKLKPLIPNTGVTQADHSMAMFVKGMIDEKSVSPVMEGQEPNTRSTATQIIEQRKMGMQKMGLPISGIVAYEKKRSLLRVYDILTHWTLPQKLSDGISMMQNQYKTITVKSNFKDGSGNRIIEFTKDVLSDEQTYAEEKIVEQLTGVKTRKHTINPELLKKTIEWNWYVTITPKPKEDSAIKVAQFEEFLKTGFILGQQFGIKMKGVEALTRFSTLNGEDANMLFDLQNQVPPPQVGPDGQPIQGQVPQGMMNQQLLPKTQNIGQLARQ